jgi:hypothetical protein
VNHYQLDRGNEPKTAKVAGADEIITIDGLRVEYPDGFGFWREPPPPPVIVPRGFQLRPKQVTYGLRGRLGRAAKSEAGATLPIEIAAWKIFIIFFDPY